MAKVETRVDKVEQTTKGGVEKVQAQTAQLREEFDAFYRDLEATVTEMAEKNRVRIDGIVGAFLERCKATPVANLPRIDIMDEEILDYYGNNLIPEAMRYELSDIEELHSTRVKIWSIYTVTGMSARKKRKTDDQSK